MAISLPELLAKYKSWLSREVRLDNWSLDPPSALATQIGTKHYPSNTVLLLPPNEITFEESNFGLLCTATIRFQIKYRFTRNLEYDALPLESATGIMNNIYFEGILNRAEISPSIISVATPDPGTEVLVSRVDPNTQSDWLIILNPIFRVTFQAAKADVSDIQPREGEEPIRVQKLDIAVYRGYAGFDPEKPETFTLDQKFTAFTLS